MYLESNHIPKNRFDHLKTHQHGKDQYGNISYKHKAEYLDRIFMNFHIQTPVRHMMQFSVLNYSFSEEYAMDSGHSKWIYA